MKALILYGSYTRLTHSHKLVTHPKNRVEFYVRSELFDGGYPEALDKAKPLEGEIVLNTVPINTGGQP